MNWKFIKSIDVKIHFNLIFLMVSQNCRFCNSNLNRIFVDLGHSPLANSYLKESDFDNEKFYTAAKLREETSWKLDFIKLLIIKSKSSFILSGLESMDVFEVKF